MGAPSGAPGAIGEANTPRGLTLTINDGRRRNTIDVLRPRTLTLLVGEQAARVITTAIRIRVATETKTSC